MAERILNSDEKVLKALLGDHEAIVYDGESDANVLVVIGDRFYKVALDEVYL